MPIWAIADLHLSFGVPDKHMKVFGPEWEAYTDKISYFWNQLITPQDLVLIPGDISWAMHLNDAQIDLNWIGQLPGTKVMIKGNHDYWWGSLSKAQRILPDSCHLIQNNSFDWKGITIGGTRLWDSQEYDFKAYINYRENPKAKNLTAADDTEESEKIFRRELGRLETSLKSMNSQASIRFVMTHYPPIGADLKSSSVSNLLEAYQVNHCVFGHLHNVKKELPLFGQHNGIHYTLTSCDYLDFKPACILA